MIKNLSPLRDRCHVTGSTAAMAIGVSKYKSRSALLKEKQNYGAHKEEPSAYQQALFDYGNIYEVTAIQCAKIIYPTITPAPFSYLMEGTPNEDRRYGATPDGFVDDDTILEVKCPVSKRIYAELEDGYAPIEHFIQMMMEMACHLRQKAVYVVWTPTQICFAHISFDMEIWTDIFKYLLVFSDMLMKDLDGKFKSGEKQFLVDKFIKYSKQQTRVLFVLEPDHPFWGDSLHS
jgi:predicted phage-related endonuclease